MKWSKLSKKLKKYVMGGVVQPGEGSYINDNEPSMTINRPETAQSMAPQTQEPSKSAENFALLRGKLNKNVESQQPVVDKVQKFVFGGTVDSPFQASSMSLDSKPQQDEKEKTAKLENEDLVGGMQLSSAPTSFGGSAQTPQEKAKAAGKAGSGMFTNIAKYKDASDISGLQTKTQEKAKGIVSDIGQAVAAKAQEYQTILDAPETDARNAATVGKDLIDKANRGETLTLDEQTQFRNWQEGNKADGSTFMSGIDTFVTDPEALATDRWGRLNQALGAKSGADLMQAFGSDSSTYYTPGASRLTGGLISQNKGFQQSIKDVLNQGVNALGSESTEEQRAMFSNDPTKFMSAAQLQEMIKTEKGQITGEVNKLTDEKSGLSALLNQTTSSLESKFDPTAEYKKLQDQQDIINKINERGVASLSKDEMNLVGINSEDIVSNLKFNPQEAYNRGYFTQEEIDKLTNSAKLYSQITNPDGIDYVGGGPITEADIRASKMNENELARLKALYSLSNREEADLSQFVDKNKLGQAIPFIQASLNKSPALRAEVQNKLDAINNRPVENIFQPVDISRALIGITGSNRDGGNSQLGSTVANRGQDYVDKMFAGLESTYGIQIPENVKNPNWSFRDIVNAAVTENKKRVDIAKTLFTDVLKSGSNVLGTNLGYLDPTLLQNLEYGRQVTPGESSIPPGFEVGPDGILRPAR